MKLAQFKNPELVTGLVSQIENIAKQCGNVKLMEVCGTHTMAIAKNNIKSLLPKNINLISGPGCPVCVTPNETIDKFIAVTRIPNTIIASYGDMMRVPGSTTSLMKEKSKGADVRVVYSSLDALNLAKSHKNKNVIFLSVGFETTTPTTAATILKAKELGVKNFYVLNGHKNMPNVMRTVVEKTPAIDGFILPGHVCTITGLEPFNFLADKFQLSGVVSGFEVLEILKAIKMLLQQIASKTPKIENAYTYAVKQTGNIAAQNLISKVFATCDSIWRGIGAIKNSGYIINEEYSDADAEKVFGIKVDNVKENPACKCGEILKGNLSPEQCPLFKKTCNPQNPIGPCMVSTEGTCAAHYKYNL